MTPKEFVTTFREDAFKSYQKTGILPEVTLGQSALETGWGRFCPGNMMFGVKDFDGVNGNEQLVMTFEYSKNPGLTPKQIGLHNIKSIALSPVQSKAAGMPMYKYTGEAYFRKYNSPEESFTDHCRIFLTVKRYAPAMAVKHDAEKFIRLMSPIYAQAPSYADTLILMSRQIKKLL